MNGNASSSARARSLPTCVLACALAIASPPSSTSCSAGELALEAAEASSWILESDLGLKYATT